MIPKKKMNEAENIRTELYEIRELLDLIEIDLPKLAKENKSAGRRIRLNCSAIGRKATGIRRSLLNKKV